jgi:hypothetical protein
MVRQGNPHERKDGVIVNYSGSSATTLGRIQYYSVALNRLPAVGHFQRDSKSGFELKFEGVTEGKLGVPPLPWNRKVG